MRIVPGSNQQLPGGVHAYARQRHQCGRGRRHHRGQLGVQVVNLGLQHLPAAGQRPQRGLGRGRRITDTARPERCADADPLPGIQLPQLGADLFGRRDDDGVDLGTSLNAWPLSRRGGATRSTRIISTTTAWETTRWFTRTLQ